MEYCSFIKLPRKNAMRKLNRGTINYFGIITFCVTSIMSDKSYTTN